MIKDLAHACYTVRDLETSLKFYRDTLGLERAFDFVNEKGERTGVYLKVGKRSFIELFLNKDTKPGNPGPYQHICLEVDDIQKTVAEFRAKGLKVTDPKLGKDNSWQAWITDPDENKIELHCYTATSWQAPHLV
jgi:catechol 2,3-dioxygenase-like lactoylglutathione lyase family enzyme